MVDDRIIYGAIILVIGFLVGLAGVFFSIIIFFWGTILILIGLIILLNSNEDKIEEIKRR